MTRCRFLVLAAFGGVVLGVGVVSERHRRRLVQRSALGADPAGDDSAPALVPRREGSPE